VEPCPLNFVFRGMNEALFEFINGPNESVIGFAQTAMETIAMSFSNLSLYSWNGPDFDREPLIIDILNEPGPVTFDDLKLKKPKIAAILDRK